MITTETQGVAREDPAPEELLGDSAAGQDWKLQPATHAERLNPRAVALKRILQHSAIEEIMRRYDRYGSRAGIQQAAYKKYGRLEIYMTTIAAILGGMVLLMDESQDFQPYYDYLRYGFLFIQLICAAGVVGLKYLLQAKKSFEEWQKARSEAETARIELFETVCGLTERNWDDVRQAGDYPLLPLQLEYFVRYQLMIQISYYDERGAEHRAAAARYVSFGAILTFLIAFVAGLGGMFLELVDTTGFAAMVAMVAPLLLGAQTSLSRLNQDERNAARYAITHAHLDKISGKLSDIRQAAADGRVEPVRAFIREVDEIISVEHSQWKVQASETATPDKSE